METSSYKIYWAEFTPMSGRVVTKHDRKCFGEILCGYTSTRNYRKHFPSKEEAIEYLKTFDKKLDKKYMVRLFTDKQFALAKQENGYAIPYTKKQLNEVYYVG